MNFLGLINFFEKVPNPLISTFLSKATASDIASIIISIDSEISDLFKLGKSRFKDASISERVKDSFFFYSLNFNEILSLSASIANTIHSSF